MPITLDGTNGITQADQFNSDSTFGFKNRIINGAMVIDQRNAGASVTPNNSTNVFVVDRFLTGSSVNSKLTAQQNQGAVTPPTGFTNYLGLTSSSAYSVSGTDNFWVGQWIEGYNVADLAWGTANAKTVTLSFWVRSSLTGTFGGSFNNSAYDRSYPFSYTISSANTWEYKTITVAGDTSGTWLTTNGIGIRIFFGLGIGSTYSGTAGSWSGSLYLAPTGATSVVGTNGATFYITGVQLEVGSTATSFDYRPYGTELVLCQRYYEKSVAQGTAITANTQSTVFPIYSTTIANNATYAVVKFSVVKRASATVTTYPYTTATNTTRFSSDTGTDFAANSAYVNAATDAFFSVANTTGGTLTTGAQNLVLGNWYASAEL